MGLIIIELSWGNEQEQLTLRSLKRRKVIASLYIKLKKQNKKNNISYGDSSNPACQYSHAQECRKFMGYFYVCVEQVPPT